MEPGTFAPLHLTGLDIAVRLGAALLFSLGLGLERFLHRKPVDFRPFVIIALTSCAVIIAIVEFAMQAHDASLSVDPAKVMSGVLTGIGFLGAGALFREKQIVHGAGSAAAIWAGGAIGIICGFGLIWLAAFLTAGVVATLVLGRPIIKGFSADAEDE